MKTSTLVAILFLIGIAMALSGCTNLKLQWSASYQTGNLAAELQREEPKPLPPISYRIGK